MRKYLGGKSRNAPKNSEHRLYLFASGIIILFLVIVGRLFQLQVIGHETYLAEAASTQEFLVKLPPERGEIFIQDRTTKKLFPAALNKDTYTLYIEPNRVIDKEKTVKDLAELTGLEQKRISEKIKPRDPYEVIVRGLEEGAVQKILGRKITGIGFEREPRRFYPDNEVMSHITGFLGQDEKGLSGRYGLEGFWNVELSGKGGFVRGEKDAFGRLIAAGRAKRMPPQDGTNLILTIDRTVQFFACEKLAEFVKKFSAQGGTVVIMDPKTGALLALCSVPNFNPNRYGEVKDAGVYVNSAIFTPYEPGSVFKPITMAAGLDSLKVDPSSTYEDKGVVKIGSHEIKNSDEKANGLQTMAQVLEKSLNTGAVYVVRLLGRELFRKYVTDFGFGSLTGIELDTEVYGDISNLSRRGEIYSATASFGQGLAVTPIQLASAFGAIANSGKLMKSYIVAEIRKSDGTVIKTEPKFVRQVISERAATVVGSMMTAVVENGHGRRAGVPGYFVAGKTGTAQIPHPGGGYYKDETIGSFVGFAPTTNPRFVMLVKVVRPQGVKWAESTAAPLFGEIAKLLLNYLEVLPERK